MRNASTHHNMDLAAKLTALVDASLRLDALAKASPEFRPVVDGFMREATEFMARTQRVIENDAEPLDTRRLLESVDVYVARFATLEADLRAHNQPCSSSGSCG